ncbi:MAG: biopolymer transporter ExbD [Victivallales bacterium]|nr:biopolymer transporter ExbD [Victivallales bacterium]
MRNRHLQMPSDSQAEINMSPMVDMIFLLLIFFMVTTVFTKDAGIDIMRPTAETATELPDNTLVLTLSGHGEIRHSGQLYQLKQIPALLKEQIDGNGTVTIIADKMASTGLTIQLIDQCRLGGIENVSIAASTESP